MNDAIAGFIHENEPVSRGEVREQFGREGVKALASLIDESRVFEGEDGEYWSVGTEGDR